MTELDVNKLADALRSGDRRALSRAITLSESLRKDDAELTATLLAALSPDKDTSRRIGITGSPGAGKSTLIEALGDIVIAQGSRLAVLTVDPSSDVSGGSVLGDKVRMGTLSQRSDVFVRSTPAGGHLGGIARFTRNAIALCEAAGFDTILVETVGVGQSEQAVAGITDLVLLVLNPGGGDEMQGIKRGLLERADVLFVNKADGELETKAKSTAHDYRNALRLVDGGEKREVLFGSAQAKTGISELWDAIGRIHEAWLTDNTLVARRQQQTQQWADASLRQSVADIVLASLDTSPAAGAIRQQLLDGALGIEEAARLLLDTYSSDQQQGES